MSLPIPQDFDLRAQAGLLCLQAQPELRRAVWAEVNAFFQRHPEIERTELGAAFVACALLDAWGQIGGAETSASTQPNTQAA